MPEKNAPLILLVEDDRDINLANRCALELEGYRVVSATTLALGERLAAEMRPDLVLLDVLLPDGNALPAGQRMAERYGCSVLYLSCLSDSDDVIAGLKAGGDDYLGKPYVMEELLLRVEAVLRRRRPRAGEAPCACATGRLAWREAALVVMLDGEGSVHNAIHALRSKIAGSGCAIERVRGRGYRIVAAE